jgi:uncharacterized RmlC-like cupin family protein
MAAGTVSGSRGSTRELRRGGEEYLLERGLYRRKTTGDPVAPWALRLAYPFRWFYSVLHAAEYFREASLLDDTPPDPRMADAIERIREQRRPDGTWAQARRHPGRAWFEVDVPAGGTVALAHAVRHPGTRLVGRPGVGPVITGALTGSAGRARLHVRSGDAVMGESVRKVGDDELRDAQGTPGLRRRAAFDADGHWFGHVEAEPETMSGWHHHGDNVTVGYVLKGQVTLEFGPGGGETVEVDEGEYFEVPKFVVHREGNLSGEAAEAILARVGEAPVVFPVDGPDPA